MENKGGVKRTVDGRIKTEPGALVQVPSLEGPSTSRERFPYYENRDDPIMRQTQSGIHAIQVNPGGRLLATGGRSVCDVAVYRLPDLSPVAVGCQGHSDWLFDLRWIDDEYLVSGGRDSRLSLWRVRDHKYNDDVIGCHHVRWHSLPQPHRYAKYREFGATGSVVVPGVEKVRALAKMAGAQVALTTLNSTVAVYDLLTLQEKKRAVMTGEELEEMVTIQSGCDDSVLVVGTRRRLLFLHPRSLQVIHNVRLPASREWSLGSEYPCSVRSLSMRGPVVTLGTGRGEVLFYDVRGRGGWVECCHCDDPQPASLLLPPGHERREDEPLLSQAVYTHAYDPSGTRLFTAGGPINLNGYGAFAALWS